jgi:hypothetical protein
MQEQQQSQKQPKIALFTWSNDEINWGGWQGFSGIYKRRSYIFDTLNSPLFKDKDRAEIVDFRTLKRIARFTKINGKWSEVR